jgi:Na+-translocating ferredoxin:NAD+ oxidoreductase RnfD subunit
MSAENVIAAPEAVVDAHAPARKGFTVDQRWIAPLFITALLFASHAIFHNLEDYRKTLLAIGTAVVFEVVLGRIFTGKMPHLASSYITGISVGILVRSPEFWPYALCAAISITSKYVIRYHNRHIWNPSNFGIGVLILLAHGTAATLSIQWTNTFWPALVIWSIGCIIVARLNRLHITLTYVACFMVFAVLRSLMGVGNFQSEIAPITSPMYQLFIFFMITDPKTTVSTKRGQLITVVCIASMEMLFRTFGSQFPKELEFIPIHAPYYSLFLVGPVAYFIDITAQERKKKLAAA